MSNQKTPLLQMPVAVQAITAAGLFVTFLGAVPAAGGRAYGCLAQACTKAGQVVTADVLGTTPATAGAAFAVDVPLMLDAAGRVIAWTAGNIVVGTSMEAAINVGDRVEIFLIKS